MFPFVLAIGGVTLRLSDFRRATRPTAGRFGALEPPGRLGNPLSVC